MTMSVIKKSRFFVSAALVMFSFLSLKAQKTALIVSQYEAGDVKALIQHIYKLNFENGEFKGKEKLLSVVGKAEGADYVRTDMGENVIYRNRYLITGIGNIIDLEQKKVVSHDRTKLVKCSGDSIIFYTNDIFKGKFYSVFNCKTGIYAEVKALLFKPQAGQDVGVDYETQNRRIWLYPIDKEKILLVNDAGFGENLVNGKTADIPLQWIDNNNFVYPYYNNARNEVTLMKVNVNKTQTRIGVIKDVPASHENSYFTKDGQGNIEYVCSKGKYVIDANGGKITEVVFEHLGNDFDVEYKNQSYGHLIKHAKTEIGKYHCELKTVKAGKNMVGLNNQLVIGKEIYPQGLAVWNGVTKKWRTIDMDDVAAVIGWIE
jgi:hypothetical protein